MATIVMTDQQIKQYVDNVFDKYDKDKSYTLDLKELSEFLNDLVLARGGITLVSLEQAKNSMRVLNAKGDDAMTKQTFYNSLQRFNGSVDDIVVAIIQTMNASENLARTPSTPNLKMTNSYIPARTHPTETKITQSPSLNNIASQGTSRYQIDPNQTPQINPNAIQAPQPYKAEPVRHQSAPMPYTNQHPYHNLTKTVPTYQNQQQIYANQQPSYRHQQRSQNNIYQLQQNYGYQNPYMSPQVNYNMGMNSYGIGMNSYGGVGGGMDMNAPVPPFNPLAALSFF